MGKGFFVLATASLLVAIAWSQGSAGQYGQSGGSGGSGFGGGGFGGGGLGGGSFRWQDADRAKAPEDEGGQAWTSKQAILTPGDRVEYKFSLKANEAIFASVTSDAFDPALSMSDAKGVELVKNDDREEGNQSPFLIFRAPKEGEYLLKVLSYRSAAGGKFTLRFRRFPVQVVDLGTNKYSKPPTFRSNPDGPQDDRLMLVLRLKAQQVINVRSVLGQSPAMRLPFSLLRIVGPTGVADRDYEHLPTPSTTVLRAKKDGDLYLEFQWIVADGIETTLPEVEVIKVETDTIQPIKLAASEVKVVEFQFTDQATVRSAIGGARIQSEFNVAGSGEPDERQPTFFSRRSVDWSNDDVLRVFVGNGTARLAMFNFHDQPVTVSFTNTTKVDEWNDGAVISDNLKLGETRFWILKSSKSDLMRVAATAKQFRLQFEIVRFNGQVANSLGSLTGDPIRDDLYFPNEDRFIIMLSCIGNGGSGAFQLSRKVLEPKPIGLASLQSFNLDGGNFGLYSVSLQEGKRYEVVLNRASRVDLLDDGGRFLNAQTVHLGSVTLYYFVPERTGRHRLWLRGDAGERKFRIQETVPPKLDG